MKLTFHFSHCINGVLSVVLLNYCMYYYCYCCCCCYYYYYYYYYWLVAYSTVGETPVFGRRTDPVLRLACSRQVTTVWVNRPLQVSQLGQLSLSSFRGR